MTATLPLLREDLGLFESAPTRTGTPTWTLHDPARNQFYLIEWPVFEVLSRWWMGDPRAVVADVNEATTLAVDIEDVASIARFLEQNNLLQASSPQAVQGLIAGRHRTRQGFAQTLLHHYLFFRIPIVRPDRVLDLLAPVARVAMDRRFLFATLLALLVAVPSVVRQSHDYGAAWSAAFSYEGLFAFAAALVVSKALHELGHALAAKSFGCRVPTMGIALVVMTPMLYTDTNEAWKLKSRRERLVVAAAGIATELVLAIWATLAWSLLDDGIARQTAFVLSSTLWMSTLVVNLSPMTRFDGYYVLSDWLNLPNLHARAFAFARRHLRRRLFGLDEPAPEHVSPRLERGLIAFAYVTWIYRVVLFVGIALLVYHAFYKPLGVFLFAVEIWWFTLRPVLHEVRHWVRVGALGADRAAGRRLAILLAIVAIVALVPWRASVVVPAVVRAERQITFYAPVPGRIEKLNVADGATVAAETEVLRIASPDLDFKRATAARHAELLRAEIETVGVQQGFTDRYTVMLEDYRRSRTEAEGLAREAGKMTISAPFAGRVVDMAPGLREELWVKAREPLLTVIDPTASIVEAYAGEEVVHRIVVGARAAFRFELPGRADIVLRVVGVDLGAGELLPAPLLAAQNGGTIAARSTGQGWVPEGAIYRVALAVEKPTDAPLVAHQMRGSVSVDVEAESLLVRLVRRTWAVLVRESGL